MEVNYPSNIPAQTLKLRGATGVRQKPRATADTSMVRWVDHPILRLGKCILYDSALTMAGYHATDWDIIFGPGLKAMGVSGDGLLDALTRRLPQAPQLYCELRGVPLTDHICLDRVDKMFRAENRVIISTEHPYHSNHLRPVIFWMKAMLQKTGGAENTFHDIDPLIIPAPLVHPRPKRK